MSDCSSVLQFVLLPKLSNYYEIKAGLVLFHPLSNIFFLHSSVMMVKTFFSKVYQYSPLGLIGICFFIHHLNSTSVLLSPPSTLDNFMVLGFVICARFLFFFGYTCARSSEPRYKLGIVIGKLVTYLVLILQPNFINGIAVTILFLPGSTRIHVSYAQASSMIVLLRIMDTYLISESTHGILISLQGQ